jgi:hypothetical protein
LDNTMATTGSHTLTAPPCLLVILNSAQNTIPNKKTRLYEPCFFSLALSFFFNMRFRDAPCQFLCFAIVSS